MSRFFPLVVAVLVFFVVSGCGTSGSSSSSVGNSSEKTEHITPEYSVSVPASWEVYPKEEYPATILFAARQNVSSAAFPASVSVSTVYSKPASLAGFVSKNLEAVRRVSQDVQVISQTDVSDATADKMLVEYSERHTDNFSRIGFFTLYVIPKNANQSYVVTMLFDESISTKEKEELQKIVGSFMLVEKK